MSVAIWCGVVAAAYLISGFILLIVTLYEDGDLAYYCGLFWENVCSAWRDPRPLIRDLVSCLTGSVLLPIVFAVYLGQAFTDWAKGRYRVAEYGRQARVAR